MNEIDNDWVQPEIRIRERRTFRIEPAPRPAKSQAWWAAMGLLAGVLAGGVFLYGAWLWSS